MGDATNVQAVQRLIDRHGVHAVINGYNIGSGAAIQDTIADSGIIYVHYDTTIGHNNLIKSDPERYFGSFQGDPAEYWYGSGFLDFLKGLETAGSFARQQQDGGDPVGRRLCRQHRQRDQGKGRRAIGWEISLFETVNVPTSEWGPTLAKIRQDPPAVIAVTHFLPADLGAVHGPVRHRTRRKAWSTCNMARRSRPSARSPRTHRNGVLYATLVGALQDEIGTAFETRYKAKFGENAGHNSGAQPYDGCYLWATAAALAGGTGEPDNADQNRKVADRMRNLIWRGVCRHHALRPRRTGGLHLSRRRCRIPRSACRISSCRSRTRPRAAC
jgi:branched-chain amino acid transport system substrate-binding protein